MDFDFSITIKGKLGQLIERAINNSAERDEALKAARHENSLLSERLEKQKLTNRLNAEIAQSKDKPSAAIALEVWREKMRNTVIGSRIAGAIADYYLGWDSIPTEYYGLSEWDTVILFEELEGNEEEAAEICKMLHEIEWPSEMVKPSK